MKYDCHISVTFSNPKCGKIVKSPFRGIPSVILALTPHLVPAQSPPPPRRRRHQTPRPGALPRPVSALQASSARSRPSKSSSRASIRCIKGNLLRLQPLPSRHESLAARTRAGTSPRYPCARQAPPRESRRHLRIHSRAMPGNLRAGRPGHLKEQLRRRAPCTIRVGDERPGPGGAPREPAPASTL